MLLLAGLGFLVAGSAVQAALPSLDPPRVAIESVLVDGDPLPLGDEVAPPLGRRNLTFRYRVEGAASHSFRMERLEAEWAEGTDEHAAHYRALDPGEYVFHVRAGTPDGAERVASLPVRIAPFFRETAAFRLLLFLLGAGLVGAVYAVRTRAVRRRLNGLERLVAERSRALEQESDRDEAAFSDAERAVEAVGEQAPRLLRMDHVKSRLLANLSHEFRTPLMLILDPLERAGQGALGPLSDEGRRALSVAEMHARRLLRLIDQLLDLAQLETGRMHLHARRDDLVAFVRRSVSYFEAAAQERGLALLFHAGVSRLPVYFDPDKIEKVLYNLIANALRATPEGGRVLVAVHEADGSAELLVRDTGTAPEQIGRPYHVGGGAGGGIGLAIVREFAEMHRGELAVESEVGQGTTFIVRLPLGRDHLSDYELAEGAGEEGGGLEADASSPDSDGTLPDDGRPLVLVVEDHDEIRRLIRAHLRPHYRIAEAANGNEALRLAQAEAPDLVISDVVMPAMDGVELCRRLREDDRLADVPIILLSARADPGHRQDGLGAGADEYLAKPISGKELVLRARHLIERRAALRERYSHEVVLQPFGLHVPSADAAFMGRVFAAIEARLADSGFTVGELAEAVGISEAQLKRRLRALADQSPVEFVRNYRLERAAELLSADAGRVGEVAYAVGFESASYFARCFRERFGVPPSKYPKGGA